MDSYTKLKLSSGSTSLKETAKIIAGLYVKKKRSTNPIKNSIIFGVIFKRMIQEKITVKDYTETDEGNYFLHNNLDWYPLRNKFLEVFKKIFKANCPKEYSSNYSSNYKYDLPTQILYYMLLESKFKRKGLAGANDELAKEILKDVHQEVKNICPYQTYTLEKEFVEVNLILYRLFLCEFDPSLKESIDTANLIINIPVVNIPYTEVTGIYHAKLTKFSALKGQDISFSIVIILAPKEEIGDNIVWMYWSIKVIENFEYFYKIYNLQLVSHDGADRVIKLIEQEQGYESTFTVFKINQRNISFRETYVGGARQYSGTFVGDKLILDLNIEDISGNSTKILSNVTFHKQ
ncbi:MAG: hypothetical protein H7329_07695 [Opitutaceae bacterium]|nr:hypothetical protein [Cytophagales bacterium]